MMAIVTTKMLLGVRMVLSFTMEPEERQMYRELLGLKHLFSVLLKRFQSPNIANALVCIKLYLFKYNLPIMDIVTTNMRNAYMILIIAAIVI